MCNQVTHNVNMKEVMRMVDVLVPNARELAKQYLKEHGIKQSFVADKMGISEPTISARLNGKRRFDADFAIAFSKALQILPSIFLK